MNLSRISVSMGILFLLLVFISSLTAQPLAEDEALLLEEFISDESAILFEESVLAEDQNLIQDFDDYFVFVAPELVFEVPSFETRSLDDIFPGITRNHRRMVLSATGLRHSFEKDGTPVLIPNPDTGIDLISDVMRKNPSHIIEALVIVPYNERELDMLDIYNALGRIENIKDQTLLLRNGNTFNVFKETTRVTSPQNRRAVPDPAPSATLPFSETMYLRFTDSFIGDIYIRGDMSLSLYGLTYNMTNFRDVHFAIFRIMRAERVSINIYLEPVKEGVLIYSMSGIYLPGFIVNRMNVPALINNRVSVLMNWITEGLRIQESVEIERDIDILRNNIFQNNNLNRLLNN